MIFFIFLPISILSMSHLISIAIAIVYDTIAHIITAIALHFARYCDRI